LSLLNESVVSYNIYFQKFFFNRFDDLVVGAPQYANTKPNQGAIYVYLNNQNVSEILCGSPKIL